MLHLLGRDIWENEQQFDQIRQIQQELEAIRRDIGQRSGLWAPGISFGGAAVGITYSTQAGFWFRQGHLVICWGQVVMTNNGSSTGAAALTGLPFAVKNSLPTSNAHGFGVFTSRSNVAAGGLDELMLFPTVGSTALIQRVTAGSTGTTVATDTDLTNTFDGKFGLVYVTGEE